MDNLKKDEHRIFLMEQTFATLFSVTNKVQMNADHYLDILTSRQLLTLVALIHLPEGDATLKQIASKIGSSKQSTKHIIDGLKKKGYINIEPNQNDKRAINITITSEGKKVMMEDAVRGYEFFDKLFRDFSNEELELLWSFHQRLYAYDGEKHDGFEEAANLPL